jgi:hypothetical protein
MSNTDSTYKREWTQVLALCKQLLIKFTATI